MAFFWTKFVKFLSFEIPDCDFGILANLLKYISIKNIFRCCTIFASHIPISQDDISETKPYEEILAANRKRESIKKLTF